MPGERLSMRKIREVLRLRLAQGLPQRAAAQSLRLSQGAVHSYMARARRVGLGWPLPDGLDDIQLEALLFPPPSSVAAEQRPMPDWAVVHRELRRPNVTLSLLWEEYRGGTGAQDGFGYSWFCDLYREWVGRLKPTLRQVHTAGERVFVDFAGHTMEVIDGATGEVRRAEIFVAVLGASSYTFAEASWTNRCRTGLPCTSTCWRSSAGCRGNRADLFQGAGSGLCGRRRYVVAGGRSTVFVGGPRMLGHITGYKESSQSSRVLSSFQAARARDATEIPELTSQTRRASALARKVNSA